VDYELKRQRLIMENIKNLGKDIHIFLCVIAVIAASIIINILIRSGYGMEGFVIGIENYEIIRDADSFEIILVTIYTRIKQLAVVYVLYRLVDSEMAYNGIVMFSAFAAGSMICIQTFYEGLTGVIELILFLFPHYIFYFLAIRTMYIKVKRCNKIGTRGMLIVFFAFSTGILCELFFSKIFLNEFYQYMGLN
jgi:hypothetical protein